MTNDRRSSPAALRNRDPILGVLRDTLPATGLVVEVASGSGEHVVHFARAFPDLAWQPSDPAAAARASIAGWIAAAAAEGAAGNIRAPLDLDAMAADWPIDRADALIAINLVHISPWAATLGLLRHAARLLGPGAPLFLYGPYRRAGEAMAPGNVAFDADLRARDPAWGIRAIEDVGQAATAAGFALERAVAMPANNLSLVLRRA